MSDTTHYDYLGFCPCPSCTDDLEREAAEDDERRLLDHAAELVAGARVTWRDARGDTRHGTSMGATAHAAFIRVVVDGTDAVAIIQASQLTVEAPHPATVTAGPGPHYVTGVEPDANVRSDWEVS